jgi:hypothetical protein
MTRYELLSNKQLEIKEPPIYGRSVALDTLMDLLKNNLVAKNFFIDSWIQYQSEHNRICHGFLNTKPSKTEDPRGLPVFTSHFDIIAFPEDTTTAKD